MRPPTMSTELTQQHNTLERLPTELKYVIARLMDCLSDHQSLGLVNKSWSDVSLPILWETFTLDLLLSGQRDMLGLASAGSNITKYVRNLNMLGRPSLHYNEDQLPLLLSSMPREQLRSFHCGTGVATVTLMLLLRVHLELKNFSVPSGETANLLQSPWTNSCFSKLTRISIYVNLFSHRALACIWAQCPSLAYLRITRFYSPHLPSRINTL